MIFKNYKLVQPKILNIEFNSANINDNDIVIRPTYMSICAADQRYYQGTRSPEALKKKLPLTLIHECVGKVLYDPKNEFNIGEKVVIVPNIPAINTQQGQFKENYRRDSLFSSSSADGFMRDIILTRRDRVVKINNINEEIGSLIELVSVAVNAVEVFKEKIKLEPKRIGVWGTGSLGFIQALVLRDYYPNATIAVLGTSKEKNSLISFANERHLVSEIPNDFEIDHAFECVGGIQSGNAINQIIDYIKPEGVISLLGVSEEFVDLNTRMVLEKGLSLVGHSRSGVYDFKKSVEILSKEENQNYLESIISDVIEINDVSDIHKAFEKDIANSYKTVMKWNI